jgi:hypothetical protein
MDRVALTVTYDWTLAQSHAVAPEQHVSTEVRLLKSRKNARPGITSAPECTASMRKTLKVANLHRRISPMMRPSKVFGANGDIVAILAIKSVVRFE